MSILYRRATPLQARILRVVEGAVKNTTDAHPEWPKVHPRLARSVAKRAAGTLTALGPDVLARQITSSDPAGSPHLRKERQQPDGPTRARPSARGASHRLRRSPIKLLHNKLGAMAGDARRAGNTDLHAALVDALRLIAELRGRG